MLKKDVWNAKNYKKNSTYIEATCEMLVSELKNELCRLTHDSQDEVYL